jgi:signal transduction histidine kinase
MADQKALTEPSGRTAELRSAVSKLAASIGTRIILPYLLLTLAVAAIGAYVVTNLVTGSLQERFHNQLLDAGRTVSESMVRYEQERLEILRLVAGTDGVPEALAAGDEEALAKLVPQVIKNSRSVEAVELLDAHGLEIYGWQHPPGQAIDAGETRSGADYTRLEDVRLVLDGFVDEFGEKRALLTQTPYGLMIFTVGPVYRSGGSRELVGAVMVGTYVHRVLVETSESAVAKVTLYNRDGTVIDTTLGGGQEGVAQSLGEPSDQYDTVLKLLQESNNRYQVVVSEAGEEVPLRQVDVLNQQYVLAFGDWRLRGQSFGLFSVALPSNFIVTTATFSRNVLSLIFSLATVAVFTIGFFIARRITRPLSRLVETSVAVAAGDLEQRTGIQSRDEIGSLATSFDVMTEKLSERNRQLVEQASKLEAILNSIADGVIVLDTDGQVVTSNPAAQRVLADMSNDFPTAPMHELADGSLVSASQGSDGTEVTKLQGPRRYQVGSRVLSALAAPVVTPGGDQLGSVVVLRDITREVEADRLKDQFITGISHELRTPLTAIKGYSELLMMTSQNNLDERRLEFVRTIGENASQLLHHINELIDISQIHAGTLGLDKERLRFSELVGEVVESWRERMETKGLSLRARLSGGGVWVFGDRSRLVWAMDNLLSNAYNYTLAGGRITVRVYRENGEACVDVSDTGVGVAAADQAYLFTRFFRANNELTFGVRGVGLGLFITRAIIEAHGGRVWAQSELSVGSTFSLALPVVE